MINKVHLGDCLELMKDIPDGSIDMILCDLPLTKILPSYESIRNFHRYTKCFWWLMAN